MGRNFVKLEKKQDLFSFCDKSKCIDIYLRTQIEKDKKTMLNLYEQRSYRVMLKYKYKRRKLENRLNKIRFMLGIGELTDIFYIKAVLLKKTYIK